MLFWEMVGACTLNNNELNMGLWVCIKLDPEDEYEQNQEPSAEDRSPYAHHCGAGSAKSKGKWGKGKGVRDTVANSIVPGHGFVCQKGVGWVNALAFDLWKLARGKPDYFYCMWVGFNQEYYDKALAREEYTPRFKCKFYMQLASDACIVSNPGLLSGGGQEADADLNSLRTCQQSDRRNLILRCERSTHLMEG